MAAGSGQENSFWLSLAACGEGGRAAAGGLRFKVIAPNLDRSNTCCPGFLFPSSAVAGKNDCQRVLENEAKAKAETFTSVTGDTELLLIKNPHGGHTMRSPCFMAA